MKQENIRFHAIPTTEEVKAERERLEYRSRYGRVLRSTIYALLVVAAAAVLLATLLLPVLNSIPEHITDINVTMGYPMRGSGLWSLMNEVSALQMHLREKGGEWHFYHKQVWAIFSNSVFKSVVSPQGEDVIAEIRKAARYYIPAADFAGDPVMELIFRPVVTAPGEASAAKSSSIAMSGTFLSRGAMPESTSR